MGLADLERISDIRIDDRLRRIKRREMHRRSPKVLAEVAAISFELLAGETRQRLEAADDTARLRGCYHKGRCGSSPQLYRTISILAAITTR
jgi:hypothetical protein